MRMLAAGLLGLACFRAAGRAGAGWVEEKSATFIFQGDVNTKDAVDFAPDLEVFRRNIFESLAADGKLL